MPRARPIIRSSLRREPCGTWWTTSCRLRSLDLLAASGQQAEHLVDVGLKGAADREVWRYAAMTGAVIVTKDEDFVVLRTLEPGGPAVVWLRMGNTRRQVLLTRFAAALPKVIAKLEQHERLVELG